MHPSDTQDLDPLPVHDQLSLVTRGIELACIVSAVSLAGWHSIRFATDPGFWVWWLPIPVLLGMIAADFASGLIHWTADTWGSETMPVLGRRFVRPFRVHHVNPHDFLRRDWIDTNGDVAMIVIVVLAVALWTPVSDLLGRAGVLFLVAFAVTGLPTNQVHQWAHMPQPPRWVQRLQDWGLILRRAAHQQHHEAPHVVNYCIATGWCNPFLTSIQFFPRLETIVSRLTGCRPRADDHAFSEEALRALPPPSRLLELP